MNMLKLLKKIGESDIEYQDLSQSMLGGSSPLKGKADEIRITIPKGRMSDQFRKANGLPHSYEAFVVWIPTESLKRSVEEEKQCGNASNPS